ncbi:hypothetical protein BCR35DRAFT_328908 [Leucosporidium creatinivorum]|uniref:Uncharacterized protein n=1 Tax=Leucosporidium creatinivorum TaxID=106004 RepID=A0A1Y2G263_9BASI|nr:hypothetical protein BCR35DRAFT_328908 [Leucosporidium creatinivorum]
MGKRESLQLWSTSPTVPAFVAVPSQPRPQLSTYPSPAHQHTQQQPPYYTQEQHLTPAEKEKQDYYGEQDHWADAPSYPAQAHQGGGEFGSGRKAAPAALTILQPPRATFSEAPATPSSPAALAFGDEASSVRGREARHRANKSMDWSRFSILVKEKERKGEKSSEWLESKQSTWRKYHKLGWLGAIVVIAAVAGFNGENENKTSTASGNSSSATNAGSSSHTSSVQITSSSAATRIVATTSSSSAAAVTSSSAVEEADQEQATSTTARVTTTTRAAAAKTVETTTTTARAVKTAEASTTSASVKASSTTSAKGSAATAEDRLRKRFFNPVRIDYVAIPGEEEKETLFKRAEWEKIVWSSPKEEGSAKAKRSTGGWEETEMMFGLGEEEAQEQENAQTLEKRDWRSIEFSRPADADAEVGLKRHLSHRRHQRM